MRTGGCSGHSHSPALQAPGRSCTALHRSSRARSGAPFCGSPGPALRLGSPGSAGRPGRPRPTEAPRGGGRAEGRRAATRPAGKKAFRQRKWPRARQPSRTSVPRHRAALACPGRGPTATHLTLQPRRKPGPFPPLSSDPTQKCQMQLPTGEGFSEPSCVAFHSK